MSPGDPFILLPLAEHAREGKLATWEDPLLAVLPVLIAHENSGTRLAWPSISRVAVLSGLGKPAANMGISALKNWKWCTSDTRPDGGPAWKMIYPAYRQSGLDSGSWIRIDRSVIMKGLWGIMTPSAKKLYIVMRGLALMGHLADGGWIPGYVPDGYEESDDYAFLPAGKMAPAELSKLTGLQPRTLLNARDWLLANRMALPTEGNQLEGLLLPYDPGLYSPKALEALANLKTKAAGRPSGGALRAFRAVKKAINSSSNDFSKLKVNRKLQPQQSETTAPVIGNSRPDNRKLQTRQSEPPAPEQVFEPDF